jgi:large subunit ribosomal protein L5
MKSRLKEKYEKTIVPELKGKFQNVWQIPRLEKVVVNMRVGDALLNAKFLELALADLTALAGQKPIVTKAKTSIAQFKVRAGNSIGAKVTLRGQRAFHFLDKLFNIVLPKLRDFKGLNPNSFDGRGNFSMGLVEQLVFPEIKYENVGKVRGMDICIVTTARTDDEAREFLVRMGLPLKQ